MVRENRVFRTQAQKVYSEDILRALRVSSFFTHLSDVDSWFMNLQVWRTLL